MDLLTLPACTMAQMIRDGRVSSVDLIIAHIQRIEEINRAVNAVVTPLFDSAIEHARAVDKRRAKGERLGPLAGVPISVKDSIDVIGVRTTAGHLGRAQAEAAVADATLVARLRQAGAIPIAKTNLPDLLFAYETDNLIFGRTNNPYDLERTAGGSSGGESALLAVCGSPLGLGSDSAGSVRVPAAFCGVASLKPTSGRLPRTGHVPPAGGWIERLWQIGPMARHVVDLQLALPLLCGHDGRDWAAAPSGEGYLEDRKRPLRIAVMTDDGFTTPIEDIRRVVWQAAGELSKTGMELKEARPPGVGEQAFELEMDLLGADGCDGLDAYVLSQGSCALHPLLEGGFLSRLRGRRLTMEQFARRWADWDRYRHDLDLFFQTFDALLCPVSSQVALPHGTSVSNENFQAFSYTMAWNVGGLPAATVRCGTSGALPVNVQVVTGRWNDSLALRICRLLEERLGGWQQPSLGE